jgi:hypothetical protein
MPDRSAAVWRRELKPGLNRWGEDWKPRPKSILYWVSASYGAASGGTTQRDA